VKNIAVYQAHNLATTFSQGYIHMWTKIPENINTDSEASIDLVACICQKLEKNKGVQVLSISVAYTLQGKQYQLITDFRKNAIL
jgi:hypothetical protein